MATVVTDKRTFHKKKHLHASILQASLSSLSPGRLYISSASMLFCPVRAWIVLFTTLPTPVTFRLWLLVLSIPTSSHMSRTNQFQCSIQLGHQWTKASLDQQQCFLKEWNKIHLSSLHRLTIIWRSTNQANIREKHSQYPDRGTVWWLCSLYIDHQHPLAKPSTHSQCISSGPCFWRTVKVSIPCALYLP